MAGKKVNTEQMFQSLIKGKDEAPEPAAAPEPATGRPANPVEKKEKYRQRAFYLTERHIRAIGLKAVDTGKDKSAIVREALEQYLGEYFEDHRTK